MEPLSLKPPEVIRRFFNATLEILFPVECLGCGAREQEWLCNPCLARLLARPSRNCPFCEQPTKTGITCSLCRTKRALDGALGALPYSHPLIQSLIHAWKYQGVLALSNPLARIVGLGLDAAQSLARNQTRALLYSGGLRELSNQSPALPASLFGAPAILVPVPLHPRKQRQRGFNQAEELARELALQRKGWHTENILVRARKTQAQATLAGIDRITNARGAFCLRSENRRLNGEHILLIDDVITTASTSEEAARVLKNAGAASVWAITIAYGHPIRSS